jgi:arylsulfatase A-like enzyme/cytochrome c-type biogenesis protein CcmH/NrfG
MKSKYFVLIGAILVFTVIITAILWLKTSSTDVPETIILISIDTIRADRLGCYGYEQLTTPHIDRFATQAFVFENCFSNMPLTLPSHCSMLTGLLPPTHGVQDNLNSTLSDSVVTLAELLKEQGYHTYGIIAADVLKRDFGLDQGFDVYDDAFEDETGKEQFIPMRPGNEISTHAIKWLRDNKDKKKFMFIHFYDPHDPYRPPAPYDKQFKHAYDGEIAFTDHCISQILDTLKSLRLYDDSLIVITGDHGELLGEHGESLHGYFIYHNVLRVPLLIKPAGKGHDENRTIKDNTNLIDIAPTLLSQSGLDIPSDMQGTDLSEYFVNKQHRISGRTIFNESLYPTKYNGNTLLGIICDQWHYIQTTRPELYNHVEDPGELTNLIDKYPHRARMLQDQLKQIVEASVRTDRKNSVDVNSQLLRNIETLGYVGGSVTADFSFDQTKKDPKDLLDIHNKMAQARTFKYAGESNEAIALCRDVIKNDPNIPEAYQIMGTVLIEIQSYQEAIEIAQKKLDLVPDDASGLKLLYEAYYQLEDYSRAAGILQTIIQHDPDNDTTYIDLAHLYKKMKSYKKALKIAQKRAELIPDDIEILKIMSFCYAKTKDYAKSINTSQKILKLDSEQPFQHNSIAWILATNKNGDLYDPQKAIHHARRAVKLAKDEQSAAHPFYPQLLDTLAVALAASGQFDAAIETAEHAIKLCNERKLEPAVDRIQGHLNLFKQHKAYRE